MASDKKPEASMSRRFATCACGRARIYEEQREIESYLVTFLRVSAESAEREIDHVMPGRSRLPRQSEPAVGRGAPAGNLFGIYRDMVARELDFDGLLWNSMGVLLSHTCGAG
ncbi:hypothetical protein F5Y14DRAFT_455297 [Nemania sp. NC0429]|nr:hypothetical protein F5Y14DRAFT_455297 [Nemania sp. NC0429]